MCSLPSGNPDLAHLYCTVQNMSKRSQPPGCPTNNKPGNKAHNMTNQYPLQDNRLFNVNNNQLDPALAGCMPAGFPMQNMPMQNIPMQNIPMQNIPTVPTGPQLCPVPSSQPFFAGQNTVPQLYPQNAPNNNFNPFMNNPQVFNPNPAVQPQYSNVEQFGGMQCFPSNIASPVYRAPMPDMSPWSMNSWNNRPAFNFTPCPPPLPPPLSSSIPFTPNYPGKPFVPRNKAFDLQTIRNPISPKPLGKLLFPTIFDFKHGSFFKMLIHMSGFQAKNINIAANKNSIELRAVKEEIEKQVQDFSGYILKQVARVFYFPEPIEESKIQISISDDVIGILVPWKQNAF